MYKRDETKIHARLKSDHDYLVSLGYEVVAVALQGSQNYDLDHSDSDIDTKAIVLPKFRDLVMGAHQVSTTLVLESDEHIDVKDIRLMMENFLKQNINFLEFLFTKYIYINPLYEVQMGTLLEKGEQIARHDNYRLVNSLVGMIHQKNKALVHPYPATEHKIKEFGYDGKQLHHMIRCLEFLERFIAGESFEDCLISTDAEKLIRIKRNEEYELETALIVAAATLEKAEGVKKAYASENEHVIVKEIAEMLENITMDILMDYAEKFFKGRN